MGKKLVRDAEFDELFDKYFPTVGKNVDAGYFGANQAGKGLAIAMMNAAVIDDDPQANTVTITKLKADGTCAVVMVDFGARVVLEQVAQLGGGSSWTEHRFANYVRCPDVRFGKDAEGREVPLTLAAQNAQAKAKAEAGGYAFHPVIWDAFANNKYAIAAHFARGGRMRPFFQRGGHRAAEWWKNSVYLGYCSELSIKPNFVEEEPIPLGAKPARKK